MKKIISYSLWGNNPKYTEGAINRVKEAKQLLPDYICRFYLYDSVPLQIRNELIKLKSEVIDITGKGDWTGMFLRFYPASENDIDIMLSRDCDSEITIREVEAIRQFEQSDKSFHIMRDHPWHNIEILGGMWGSKKGSINNIKQLINNWKQEDRWQTDQEFLKYIIYPLIKNNCMSHDEFFNYESHKLNFPTKRIYDEFCCNVKYPNNTREEEHHTVLRNYLKNIK